MPARPPRSDRRLLIAGTSASLAAGLLAFRSPAASAQTDRALLDMVFVLEQIQVTHEAEILDTYDESDFTAEGLPTGTRAGFERILQAETIHLGILARPEGSPLPPPIRPEITSLWQALRDAIAFKRLTLGAYAGIIPIVGRPRIVPDLIGIHAVEARHLAWLATMLGDDPFPDAVDPAIAPADVLTQLTMMAGEGASAATPGAAGGAGAAGAAPAPLLAAIAADLGVSVDDLERVQVEPRRWPDASLGCPQPGHVYAQVITPGYLIVVAVAGERFEYHTDDRDNVVRCSEKAG